MEGTFHTRITPFHTLLYVIAVKAIATPRKRQAPADSEETAAAEVNVAEGCTKEDSAYTKRQARLAGAAARAKIRASKMA